MTNEIGAVCSASTMIPSIFYIKDICFILYYIIMLWIKHNNFFIDWKELKENGQEEPENKEKKSSKKTKSIDNIDYNIEEKVFK